MRGKESLKDNPKLIIMDHPRLCGEKPMKLMLWQKAFRITPAYAGKSQHSKIPFPLLWDHPRLCGEKPVLPVVWLQSWGSPPPMRGKACEMFLEKSGDGITPAYAGKRHGKCRYD